MQAMQNICLIDSPITLSAAFQDLGHTTLCLSPASSPFFDLAEALNENNFSPDLVLQVEHLGQRTILTGLKGLDCPTIFWASDPHLNTHWQAAYARLFDIVCSTQRSIIPQLKRQGAEDVRWLPTVGFDVPWTEMKNREHAMAFVGRLTAQRPARQWMVDFLQNKANNRSFPIEQNLTFPEMLGLYQKSKIIPNESILGEVNYRLFEGASCGSLVLTQDLGDEQASLFEPGREIDTYTDVAELNEKLDRYLNNDRLVETMGQAARERILSEHLFVHRARRILEYANNATHNRVTANEADKWTAIATSAMWEMGMISLSAMDVLAKLAPLQQDADVATATLRVQALAKVNTIMAENCSTILGGKLYLDSLDVNLSGSMAALRLNNWDGAKTFWYRQMQATGNNKSLPPRKPSDLLTLWAKELKRHDRVFQGGFSFKPGEHLPATAMDCLMTILNDEPEDLPTLHLLDVMLRPYKALDQARIGFLSILTLFKREDWRLAFESAMANLRAYRLESGMEELHIARELARDQGQERGFSMALKARDASGAIRRGLG